MTDALVAMVVSTTIIGVVGIVCVTYIIVRSK